MADENRPRVVIIGAGFGGLWAAREFSHAAIDVWLIDRNNYHTFFPLLYQVAAAELEPEDIVYPIRNILRKYPNIHYLMDEVTRIDADQHSVWTRKQKITYDYLVVSTGSKAHFFSVAGAEQHAFALKTIADAVQLRNHILCQFEAAAMESNQELRQQMLTFSIVGGGPTGVEFTGALAELVKKPLAMDYPNLNVNQVHIMLPEATDRLLLGLPESLQAYTLRHFQRMGIDVQLNSPVSQINPQGVTLTDGRQIHTRTVVWTAGVKGVTLPHNWDFPSLANGQVAVLPTLQVPDRPEVYVIGDLAYVEQYGRPLLMIATVANQEGKWAAKNILRQLSGSQPQPFVYRDPGVLAVTGRNAAVARLKRFTFSGFPAWVVWSTVHLYRLIGFRKRLLVLINWAWDYIFFDRVVRLILPLPDNKSTEKGCL